MNVIITGASSGVGYDMARIFGSVEGNRVFAIARRGERLNELTELCPSGRIIPVRLDLSELKFDHLIQILQHHGVHNIDLLVNNAGCLVKKPFAELDINDWQTVYSTNVYAPALLTSALLPFMGKAQTPSHVLMISSIGGVSGSAKFPGLAAYSSSKGALGILAEVLAEEFRDHNIKVNTIALGSVQTEMLEKAFPGYTAAVSSGEAASFICRFGAEGWRLFNGKTLEMSTGTP